MDTRGISLLETVLYIAMFALLIPAATVFFIDMRQTSELASARAQMEQTSDITLSQLNTELSGANAWNLSSSTLGSVNGVLAYTNADGVSVVIDRPTDTVVFDGTPHNINRLRVTVGAGPSEWITPHDVQVVVFELTQIEDSSGSATGLNLTMELFMLNPSGGPFRGASFSSQTTFARSPSTLVL